MFAEKVCEQVAGFSVMAEDELFDVNGGTAYDSNGNAIPGSGNNGTSTSGSKPSSSNWADKYDIGLMREGACSIYTEGAQTGKKEYQVAGIIISAEADYIDSKKTK